jgi:hypothetical protein
LDLETAIYYFRARYYHAELGRFICRDPIGYVDGMNLYRAYFVPRTVDPLGTDIVPPDLIPQDSDCCPYVYQIPIKVVVWDSDDKGGPGIAGSDDFLKVVKALGLRGFRPIIIGDGRPFYDNIFYRGDECGKVCISSLAIVDHGTRGGEIQFGESLMTDKQIDAMCNRLCDTAVIYLFGCYAGEVANGHDSIAAKMKRKCGKISVVWGSNQSNFGMQSSGLCRFDDNYPTGGNPENPNTDIDWDDVLPPRVRR